MKVALRSTLTLFMFLLVSSVYCFDNEDGEEDRLLQNVPGVRDSIPMIKCDSYEVTSPFPNRLPCPDGITAMVASTVGHVLNELTYAMEWVGPMDTSVYPDVIVGNTTFPLLGECEEGFACASDADCAPDLLCSAVHQAELTKAVLDPIKANCPTSNVCFKKSLISGVRRLRVVEQKHRELGCNKKCLPQCKTNPNAPACLGLNCSNCRRRRLMAMTLNSNDKNLLFSTATSTLREMAKWTNITARSQVCKRFLETATCKEDSSLLLLSKILILLDAAIEATRTI